MGRLFIIILIVFANRAFGAEPTVLDGDWVRVVDGCEDLPAAAVRQLPESGGGNQVSRAEILTFRENTYRSRILAPQRCSTEFKPSGLGVTAAKEECSGGTSSGSLRLDTPTRFTIVASMIAGDNPWGIYFQEFDFELIDGNVLYVHPVVPDNTCVTGDKRIYFIRAPLS